MSVWHTGMPVCATNSFTSAAAMAGGGGGKSTQGGGRRLPAGQRGQRSRHAGWLQRGRAGEQGTSAGAARGCHSRESTQPPPTYRMGRLALRIASTTACSAPTVQAACSVVLV